MKIDAEPLFSCAFA